MEATPAASNHSQDISGAGFGAFILLLQFHGIAADARQLRHQYGERFGFPEMLRAAKALGLKARVLKSNFSRLSHTPLPGLAGDKDGSCFLIGKVAGDRVLIQRPGAREPRLITRSELETAWNGELLLAARRGAAGELARRFDITWFLHAMKKYTRLLAEVLVASFFLQLFALVSPVFFQVVVDKVLVHRGLTTLDVLIVGLVLVSIFETILTALRTHLFAHTTSRIDVELGARLFRHLTALHIAYFEARRTGDSVARVREMENIRNFLTGSALTLVIDLFFTIVFLAVMAVYSLPLTAVVLVSIPLYAAVSAAVTPVFRQRLDEKFNRGAENQAFLVESITGIETLKAMAVEPHIQRRWEEQLAGYVRSGFRVVSLGNWASQGIQLINKLTTAAILFFGAHAVMQGRMTVGELVAFNMLAGRVAQPVLRLAQMWQDFQQTQISIERLGDILNTPAEPQFTPGRTALPAMKGEIAFDHVTFRYRPDMPVVLHDISLHIPAGQMVGIVGPSGSGKSTLTKLIQRLHAPEAGHVLIDGLDLGAADVSWLRRQVGAVLQENRLFNRSIRDNIAFAEPAAPIERVIEAATLAGAHEFILELPQGYDTMVGEFGASLSGGQRQRIAIARALIVNPRILILDEATSALDYESERIIHENMRRIAQGRTVIIIAHRLTAVRQCHRIVTLEKGRIVEDGSHDELVRSGGRYAHLLRTQVAND
jgi:subfamily B ATP-binding cassette protein HlyB/CyaB